VSSKLQQYTYEAVSAEGKMKKGRIPAASYEDALSALQSEGLIPVRLDLFQRTVGNLDIIKPKEDRELRLKADATANFARQLYLLVRAGLPLARSLEVIGEDHPDVRFTRMCNALAERTLAGTPLSRAMAEFPKCFDEVFCSYISAGETTGNLEEALYRLSKTLEKANQLRLKVKAVTAYPKMVSAVIALVVVGIILFLVPTYAKIYGEFGAELPAPTRALMWLADITWPIRLRFGGGFPFVHFSDTGFWFNLGLPPFDRSGPNILTTPINFFSPITWMVGTLIAWRRWRKKHADDLEIGTKIEKIKFRLPVLGKLWKTAMMHRWSSTLAGALSAGLQLNAALDIAASSSGSAWMRLVTADLKDAVQAGRPLSRQLRMHPELFDPRIKAMAATGEEAGEPAEMFESVAFTLEDELDAIVAVLGARIEVVLLVMMGTVVGSLLIVLYLPIFNLSSAASGGFQDRAPGFEEIS
jgi:type IV pilus assembly protein PilC